MADIENDSAAAIDLAAAFESELTNSQEQVTALTQDSARAVYEERYVAFIDILGFTEIIKSSENNEQLLAEINDALSLKRDSYEQNFKSLAKLESTDSDLRVHTFSDFVVLSTADTNEGLVCLLFVCWHIAADWLRQGFFCRGGIAHGKLLHKVDNSVAPRVFGPAFIEAYELEHSVADFPRVVASGKVRESVEALLKIPLDTTSSTSPLNDLVKHLSHRCDDGPTCINIFWHLKTEKEGALTLKRETDAQLFSEHISRRRQSSQDRPHYFRKAQWLVNQFNSAIKDTTYVKHEISPL